MPKTTAHMLLQMKERFLNPTPDDIVKTHVDHRLLKYKMDFSTFLPSWDEVQQNYKEGKYFKEAEGDYQKWLEEIFADKTTDNKADASDVCETVVTHASPFFADKRVNTPAAYQARWMGKRGEAITPAVNFCNTLMDNGIQVHFITARPERFRTVTQDNLEKIGVRYTELHMPNEEEEKLPHLLFKYNKRKEIQDTYGVTLFHTIGDKPSDVESPQGKKEIGKPCLVNTNRLY